MQRLGEILRAKRVALELTLEDIEFRTKIRTRYILALENGDWSILPGDVYARGFVRSYAEALGLDGLALLEQWIDNQVEPTSDDAREMKPLSTALPPTPVNELGKQQVGTIGEMDAVNQDTVAPKAKSMTTVNRSVSSKRRSDQTKFFAGRRVSGASQVVVVAGVLVVIAGVLYVIRQPNHPVMPVNQSVASATGNNSAAQVNNVIGNTVSNAVNNATGNTVTPNSVPQIVTGPFQNNTQTYTVSTAQTQALSVTLSAANSACWVSVTADGSVIDPNDTVQAGLAKSWPANQSIKIRIGNVAAVQLQINGQSVILPSTANAIDVVITKQATGQ